MCWLRKAITSSYIHRNIKKEKESLNTNETLSVNKATEEMFTTFLQKIEKRNIFKLIS